MITDIASGSDDALLIARDAARHRLGDISETRLWQLEQDGEIEVVRAGRRTFVVAESLKNYVERLRAANRPPEISENSGTGGRR